MATTKATNLGHRTDVTLKGTTTTVDSNVVVSDTTTINNNGSDVGLKINSESTGHIMQLQDSGTDVMVVADGGNVGIGETGPACRLHIKNTSANDGIRIISSTTGEGFVIFGDTADTNTGSIAYNHTADAMTFDVNNAERLRINNSGRVGIGTNGNPTAELELKGSSNPEFRFSSTDSTDPYIYFGDQTDVVKAGIGLDSSANALVLRGYNNVERLRIDSSGYVSMTNQPFGRMFTASGDDFTVSNNRITFGSSTTSGGVVFSNTNDSLTVPVAGVYAISWMVSGSATTSGQGGDGIQILLKISNTLPISGNNYITTLGNTSGDEFAHSDTEIVELDESDYIQLFMANVGAMTGSITCRYLRLTKIS